jgi:hypothetical protein
VMMAVTVLPCHLIAVSEEASVLIFMLHK